MTIYEINNKTPEYDLRHLDEHIRRGATLLIFVNRVADDLGKQREAYGWIPSMPEIYFTKDRQPLAANISEDPYCKDLAPIILRNALKLPVLQKISMPVPPGLPQLPDVVPLFFNKNYDALGVFVKRGEGQLIILPEYQSNEEIISTFLHRVLPKIYNLEAQVKLIDQFQSPEEVAINKEIQEAEDTIEALGGELEAHKESLASATRSKINTIKGDETAVLIRNYYDLAMQQDDVALFYLYKVIEVLEEKYGGEKKAKSALECNAEWNLIGKMANASYGDVRHAPKPGEKIKGWSQEEIKGCFEAAEKIISAYLATLF